MGMVIVVVLLPLVIETEVTLVLVLVVGAGGARGADSAAALSWARRSSRRSLAFSSLVLVVLLLATPLVAILLYDFGDGGCGKGNELVKQDTGPGRGGADGRGEQKPATQSQAVRIATIACENTYRGVVNMPVDRNDAMLFIGKVTGEFGHQLSPPTRGVHE